MARELRWNPLARRWVAVAGHRSSRPVDEPPSPAVAPRATYDPDCPFCPGQEDETLPPILSWPDDTERPWELRVVPNKYPSFEGTEPIPPDAATVAPASGSCEVVIFTADHDRDLADCTTAEASRMLSAIADRCRAHEALPAVAHTSVIVNRGRTSGASLAHPHAQLLSTPFVTPTAMTELEAFREDPEVLLSLTQSAHDGTIAQQPGAHALCPPWAGFPYESWIVPTDATRSITDAGSDEIDSFASLLVDSLQRLRRVLGEVDYNLAVRIPPPRTVDPFTWHIQILPRHIPLAGFELSAGIAVNAIPSGVAAEQLRSA